LYPGPRTEAAASIPKNNDYNNEPLTTSAHITPRGFATFNGNGRTSLRGVLSRCLEVKERLRRHVEVTTESV
jgi:hypothetical protein